MEIVNFMSIKSKNAYKLNQICICSVCTLKFKKHLNLSHHIRSVHKLSREQYYDKYLLKETNICVCGKKRKFNSIGLGYNKFCSKECQYK